MIKSDNVKETVDFGYESTDRSVSYNVRFHITNELGKTISLSEDGNEYVSFPAEMFIEISNFIIKRGLVKTEITEVFVEKQRIKKPKQVSQVNSLPVPNVEQQILEIEEKQEEVAVEDEPLQSFVSQEDKGEYEADGEEIDVPETEVNEPSIEDDDISGLPIGGVEIERGVIAEPKPSVTEEEAKKLWQNRQASNPEKAVKRKPENHGGD